MKQLVRSGGVRIHLAWSLVLTLSMLAFQCIGQGRIPARAASEARPPEPAPALLSPTYDPSPHISVSAGSVQLGKDFIISATFSSTGDASGYGPTGYGPFIDLYIPHTGPDGAYPGDILVNPPPAPPTIPNEYDGISPAGGASDYSATYQGQSLTIYTLNFPNSGTGCPVGEYPVDHPLALDDAGYFKQVCGKPGDQLVVIQLPFGSFTPGQPSVTVEVPAHLSQYADVGTALAIQARAGFQFGATPTVDWCCTHPTDTTILSDGDNAPAWTVHGDVQPFAFSVAKSGGATTATGPNYPHTYTISVDIASGQAVTGIDLTDTLPDNIVYAGNLTSTPAATSIVHQPAVGGPYAAETINLHYDSVTGADGTDITVTFDYYIPELDAGGSPIIPPTTGAPNTTTNNASVLGTWTPSDTRDLPATVSGTGVGTGSDRPLVVSKGSSLAVDGGGAGATPGDVVKYTVSFSVSDYFALDNLVATDTMSDGQHFDPSRPPQLVVDQNGASSTYDFDAANFDVVCDYTGAVTLPAGECNSVTGGASGTTTITFDISDELALHAADGQMLGGLVADGGTANDGATTGQIIFYSIIQDRYSDQHGGTYVKQGDSFDDAVDIDGTLLDVSTCEDASHNPQTCSPYTGNPTVSGSGSSGQGVSPGKLTKSIYAYNGTVCPTQPCAGVKVAPGDTVTYRIRYELVTGDFASLTLTDYLPLPIFHANDPNFDGSDLTTWPKYTGGNPAPDPGTWLLTPDPDAVGGQGDTRGREPLNVTISGASANNSVLFDFGSYDDPLNQATAVDILFTVRVTKDPYADGLLMTNEAQEQDANSPGVVSTTDKISQLTITEPVLVSEKSAVSTDHAGVSPSPVIPAPIVFAAPWDGTGLVPVPWSGGTINSNYLGADNSALNSGIGNLDGSDRVKFAIVVQNTGSGLNGAFDITIKDTMPGGYLPTGFGAENINLQVTRGDGTPLTYTELAGGLLGNGIEIDDPPPGDPAYGHGACQAHDAANGKNVIIVTYDLMVDPDVAPGQEIENNGQLTNYSGSEGGPNYLPEAQDNPSDSTIASPTLAKVLSGSEIVSAHNTAAQAVIGEWVEYTLTITLPEAQVPNMQVVDTLPPGMAFYELESVTPSTDVTIGNSFGVLPSQAPTHVTVGSSGGGTDNLITFDLGTVTNSSTDNSDDETVGIVYRAIVLDVAGNNAGDTLTNSATMTWDTKDAGGHTVTGTAGPVSAAPVTIIEPYITTAKLANPDATDAGNIVTFTITLSNAATTNPDGRPATDAYDLTWTDSVPANMAYQPGTLAFGACAATTTSVDDSLAPDLSATLSHLAPGESCVLTFDAAVDYAVEPGDKVTNTAYTHWTSLDDTTAPHTYPRYPANVYSVERTGSGTPAFNDYTSSGSDDVNINLIAPHKYLMSTSEPFTGVAGGQTHVAIGELIRYRLVVQIPEGTSTNFQVRDNIAETTTTSDGHLTFLNDGTARVTFVSTDSATNPIISDSIGIVPALSGCGVNGNTADGSTPAAPLACALANGNVGSSNSTTTDLDSYSSGSDVYFKLGTLHNNDSDADVEFVVIEFDALVDNAGSTDNTSNDRTEPIENSFNVFINGSQSNGSSPEDVSVYVAEPVLSVSKAIGTTPADAGDTITYTLTISSTSGNSYATAFDLNLTDALDANLNPVSAVITSTTQGDPCTGNGGGTTAFNDAISLVGQDVTLTASCLDPGKNIVVTVTATVKDTVQVPSTIPNSTILTYTSLPGNYGTTSNPTGSRLDNAALPGLGYDTTPGGNAGERTGSQTPAQNDLRATGSRSVTLASPAVDKKDPSPLQYTIGQTVTYDIWVTLPEGVTKSLVVTDNIPSGTKPVGLTYGMKYVSSQVLTNDPSLPASYNGTDVTGVTGVCTGTCSTGDDVTFTFGNVTTTADNNTNNNTFIVRIVLLVEDVRGNQDIETPNSDYPTSLVNGTTITYTSGSKTDSATAVTVIEPRITTTKSITSPSPADSVKAGDIVAYQAIFTNTGRSTAYDVTADDTLVSPGVSYNSDAVCTLNGAAAPVTVTGTTTLHFDGNPAGSWDIPVGGNVTCTYSVTVLSSMYLDGNHTNTIDADWFSLDSGGGRSYHDATSYNFDGSQDTTTSTFTTALPTLTKSDGGFTAGTVGDSIHYTITVGGDDALGTLRDLVITDTLPAGVVYDGNVTITGLSYVPPAALPTPTVSSPNDGSKAVTLTWTFHDAVKGDVYKSIADATIEFDAHIADNDTTVYRTLAKTNDVTGSYRNVGGSTVNFPHVTDGFTIIEPVITTTKNVLPASSVQAGDVLTYTVAFENTGDSIAYEVSALDTLAQGVTFTSLTSCALDAPPTDLTAVTTVDTGTPGQVAFSSAAWDIPVGSTITCIYTATAQTSLYLDGGHINTVDADWTSQNGAGAHGERVYADAVSRPGVDGSQDTKTATFDADSPTIAKDDGGVSQVVIGDTITFTLTIGGPTGTLRSAVVTDHLPAGLIYNNDAVITGLPTVLPTVSAPNDGTAQVTITWNFGDAYKSAASATIVYSARVADVPSNSIGHVLTNDVWLDHHHADDTAAPRLTSSASSTVAEAVIVTDKTVDPLSGVKAGDTVTYTVRFTNNGTATAYEVTALDTLAQGMVFTALAGCEDQAHVNVPSTATDNGDGTVTFDGNPAGSWDIAVGNWIQCVYTATAQPGIFLDGDHTNVIDADWSSQNGNQPNERLYNDSVNRPGVDEQPNGDDDDDATFTTQPANIAKSDGGVTQAVIGQTVHITLTISAPLGTLRTASVVDTLPAGLIYVSGSQSVSAGITSATFTASTPNDGTVPVTLTWDFGDAVVSSSPVTIEYDAIVANVKGTPPAGNNVDGKNLINEVHLYYTDAGGTPQDKSAQDSFLVIESDLSLDKSHAAFVVLPDAGDTVHYIVTVSPSTASHATAYDIVYTDTLPADVTLDLTGHSIVVTPTGDAGWTSSVIVDTSNSSAAANTVDVRVSNIPNTPGNSVQIEYWAVLKNTVTPSQLISNTGNLTWTSIAGPNSYERTGTGGSPNDYNTADTDSFRVHDPSFSKSVMTSSEASTADPNLAIGEVATFALHVTLPEGTTPSLHIGDDIPPGLEVVAGSQAIITTVAGSYGLLTKDFNGTLPAMTTTLPTPPASGDDISFDFDDPLSPITVAADGDPDNNSFIISFQAVLLNEPGNTAGSDLTNTATLTVSGTDYIASTPVHVVEPSLGITKMADNYAPNYGVPFTYTLTVINPKPGSSDSASAFDVVVTDPLPAGVVLHSDSPSDVSVVQTPLLCASGVDASNTGVVPNTLDVRVATLPVGCQLDISYQVEIATPAPAVGTAITNTAALTWTSLPGTPAEERTGSGTPVVNDYATSANATITFHNVDLQIAKDNSLTTVSPGDVITYTLSYSNKGDLDATNVLISETPPAGTVYDALINDPIGWAFNPVSGKYEFKVGPLAAGANGSVTFTVDVNSPAPAGVDAIENTATISDDHTHGLAISAAAGSHATTLVAAPDIKVLKDDGLDTTSPNDLLTYTLTVSNIGSQDATGVAVTDTIPDNTTFISAGKNPDLKDASFDPLTRKVTWPVFDLPVLGAGGLPYSVTLTVTVQVDDPFPVTTTTIDNLVHAEDDGRNGADTNPANNDAHDLDNVLTLTHSDLVKTLTGDSLGATVSPDVAIGEVLTYHVTFNVPPGTMKNLTVTDLLDLGLAFRDCEFISASDASLVWQDPAAVPAVPPSNDFTPICNTPVVTAAGDPANPASPGRQVLFDFHNVTNNDTVTHSITISYRVVVLDVVENKKGGSLNNAVTLDWNGGPLQISAATPLNIVEPALRLAKTADTAAALPGTVITFTLTISHDPAVSSSDAYDVLLTDVVPAGLTYVSGSLKYVSGIAPNSAIITPPAPVPPPAIDDTAAPTLRVRWDVLPMLPAVDTVIQFQAVIGWLAPRSTVTNTSVVEWTSLPGTPVSPAHTPPLPAGQESIYNDTAHERRYDPLHPADIYQVSSQTGVAITYPNAVSSVTISVPPLPGTGFAPQVVTNLPQQPADRLYRSLDNLSLEIPALGVNVPIVGVPTTSAGWDLTWLGNQAGYLDGTAYPTLSGNTGITGHVYLANGNPGPFVDLHTLRWGQEVIIHMDGQKYVYLVQDMRRVWPDDLSVLGHADVPTLTLITCQGYNEQDNSYTYRIAVRAVLDRVVADSTGSATNH